MSNLNIPKEYYINFPVKYLGTKARIETRYKINYIPSSEYENRGDYEISLQAKATWLLDRDPISTEEAQSDKTGELNPDEFCYDFYADAGAGQSSIELQFPFLDTNLRVNAQNYGVEGKEGFDKKVTTYGLKFAKDNEKWITLYMPYTSTSTAATQAYWNKQIKFPKFKNNIPLYQQDTGKMDIITEGGTQYATKLVFKNILQVNRPLILKSTLILRCYDSALPVGDDELMCRMYFRDDEQTVPTLNLEDSIGNFSVVSPNNKMVDFLDETQTSALIDFKGRVNGEKIKSFCINLYNDNYEFFSSSGWVSGELDLNRPRSIDRYNILGEKQGTIYLGDQGKNNVFDDDIDIYHYPNEDCLYNNDILNCSFFKPINFPQVFEETSSNKIYYNFCLSKYSITEEGFYNKPFFVTKDFMFEVAKPISLEIYVNGSSQPFDKTSESPYIQIDNPINKFKVNYIQNNNVPIDFYSFYLYDENKNLIDSKEGIKSNNIFYEYHCFEMGKDYILEVFVQNVKGQKITKIYDIKNIGRPLIPLVPQPIEMYTGLDNENNGVAILLKDGNLLNGIAGLIEDFPDKIKSSLIISRKDLGNNTLKNILTLELTQENVDKIRLNNYVYFIDKYLDQETVGTLSNKDFYGLIDYSAKNNKNYIYFCNIYLDSPEDEDLGIDGIRGKVCLSDLNKTILTHWDNYTIYPLIRDKGKYKLSLDTNNNVVSLKFGLNCKENEITLNQDKTTFTTFDELPKVIKGNLNYHSGSLSCLLGRFLEDNKYYEPNSLMELWEEFLKTSSCALFKNPKGDAYIVFIENSPTKTYMNEIANEYFVNQELTVKPSTISFTYIEIDKIDERLYILLGD